MAYGRCSESRCPPGDNAGCGDRFASSGLAGWCSAGAGRGCLDGLGHASYVGDLDLAGFGLLGYGDGDGEHTVVVDGVDVVTVQALAQEQLAAELAVAPLRDEDLVALFSRRRAGGPHGEDILLHGQFDRARISAGQVQIDLELFAPTVGVDGGLADATFGQHLLGDPLELAERFESHQHG
jgi:hypothetical protein